MTPALNDVINIWSGLNDVIIIRHNITYASGLLPDSCTEGATIQLLNTEQISVRSDDRKKGISN